VTFDLLANSGARDPDAADEVSAPKALKIMQAAKDLFTVEGYGAVSMDEVARSAGVSKATVYAHFGSKEKLFAAIIHQACKGFAVDLFPQVADEPDIAVALRRIASAIERFLLGEGPIRIYRIIVSEGPRFPELVQAWYETGPVPFRAMLTDFLRKATANGQLAVANPALAADQLVALVKGPLYLRRLFNLPPYPGDPSPEDVVDGAVQMILSTYRPR
jgi:TetR/AcrR family transcriptional regulator, mexJK operon transcriptional repressor